MDGFKWLDLFMGYELEYDCGYDCEYSYAVYMYDMDIDMNTDLKNSFLLLFDSLGQAVWEG